MRKRILFFLLSSAVFAACGSDPSSSPTSSPSSSPPPGSDASTDGAEPDSSESVDAAAPTDGASAVDSGADAAVAVVPPSPPAGATKCGQGNLTAKAIHDACELPPSFGPPPLPSCDDVTSDGGRYEVWCSATLTYVWVEIDALRPTATTATCPVAMGGFHVYQANYSDTFPSGAAAGGANLDAPVPLDMPRSFSVNATASAGTEGTMTIWLSGLDTLCPEADASFYGNMVAGAHVSWP